MVSYMLKTPKFLKKWYNWQHHSDHGMAASCDHYWNVDDFSGRYTRKCFFLSYDISSDDRAMCIHVHSIAFDPLWDSSGRKQEAVRLSPGPKTTWAIALVILFSVRFSKMTELQFCRAENLLRPKCNQNFKSLRCSWAVSRKYGFLPTHFSCGDVHAHL